MYRTSLFLITSLSNNTVSIAKTISLRVLFIGLVLLWSGLPSDLETLNAPANADFSTQPHSCHAMFVYVGLRLLAIGELSSAFLDALRTRAMVDMHDGIVAALGYGSVRPLLESSSLGRTRAREATRLDPGTFFIVFVLFIYY